MPPKSSLNKALKKIEESFNPKFVAKLKEQQKMEAQSAATPTKKGSVTIPQRKIASPRGRGRGGRGRAKRPPISLQLDPDVDVDTDDENEDMQPNKKVTREREGESHDSEKGEGKPENVEETQEKSSEREKEKGEGEAENVEETQEKSSEKEKEKGEGETENVEETQEKSSERETEKGEGETEKEKRKETNKEKIGDELPDLNATVPVTIEGALEKGSDEAEKNDDGLDPLFPPTRTRSKRKFVSVSPVNTESSEDTPPKTKPTSAKKRKTTKNTRKPRIQRAHLTVVADSMEENVMIHEKMPINTCRAMIAAPFGDSFKNEALNHLNNLELSEDILSICHGILGCCFHSGRRYKKAWYDSSPAFQFFKEAMVAQGWVDLLDSFCPVYVSEVVQLYATVKVDLASGTLSAYINNTPFLLTRDQLAQHLNIPQIGLTSYPKRDWGDIDNITVAQVMQVLRPNDVNGPTNIYALELSAPNRFIFNLIFRNLLPSNNSRGRCSLLDMLLIHHIVKHVPINLPHLMLYRINEVALELQEGTFDKNTVIPYGMWLSSLFKSSNLVAKGSPACEKLSDEMSPGLLSQMYMEVRNGQLVRKMAAKGDATVGSSVDLASVHSKLDSLTTLVSRVIRENAKLKEAVEELKTMNVDLVERLGGKIQTE